MTPRFSGEDRSEQYKRIKINSKMTSVLYVIPMEGRPYSVKIKNDSSGTNLNQLNELVEGGIESLNKKQIKIHPLFLSCHDSWKNAQKILTLPSTVVYGNQNGSYECDVNMAFVGSNGQFPAAFGIIVMKVKLSELIN